jgi:hypothetical protein
MKRITGFIILLSLISGCKKDTSHEVKVVLKDNATYRHILNQPYIDPGAYGLDYMNKKLEATIDISAVNINKTGTYKVIITAKDEDGNTGTAERQVVVYNELESLNGKWSFYKFLQGSGTADTVYVDSLSVSDTLNRMFSFTRFSAYPNAPVLGHINANLITIDSLQYFVGPAETINIHIYGTGTQINANRLEINYGEIINSTTKHYTAIVTRE